MELKWEVLRALVYVPVFCTKSNAAQPTATAGAVQFMGLPILNSFLRPTYGLVPQEFDGPHTYG